MGSYDGAESCELVGTYLLDNIKERFGNACNFGLYRDDGLGVTKASPRQAELIKKELCSIFAKYGLKITIEANKKVVNFLEVTLTLANGKYLPYNKPGNIPLYVNKKSNHPPRIIENIPKSISKRLSEISIDEDSFSKAAPLYQKALADSGYNPASNLQPEHSKDQLQLHAESKKIDGYNKSTLRKTNAVPPKACNCRQPPYCPLEAIA